MENLNKHAITNGVILGIIAIILTVLPYYTAPQMLGTPWFGITILVVSLVLYVIFTIDLRKKIGGFWSFREALKGIFLMAFIAGLVSAVFNFVFYKFIETNAMEKISGYVVDGMAQTYEKMGMNQDQIDEASEKVKESLKSTYNPTFADFFKSFGIAIIIEFVLSLIFAAIFKKDKPVFVNDTHIE